MTRRPKETDEDVIEAAARNALPRFLRAVGSPCETEDLKRSLRAPWQDGYERAKDWEYHGWHVNFALVEFLNDLDARNEHRRAVAEWVKRECIKCPFTLGAIVECGRDRIVGRIVGEITEINEAQAQVTVFCAAKGHVREGIGTRGFVVAYEDLREPRKGVAA